MLILTLLLVLMLVFVHLYASKWQFLEGIPRSRILSAAGGASTAYIFVHILPELQESQKEIREEATGWLTNLHHHAYLAAMIGFVAFYALARLVEGHRMHAEERGHGSDEPHVDITRADSVTPDGIFWLHIGSFFFYNLYIGYYIVRGFDESPIEIILFAFTMALHFLMNDFSLRLNHRRRYDQEASLLLAGAVLIGWLIGTLIKLPEPVISTIFAFLAGAILLNVIKEELPDERQSRIDAFLLGALAFSIVLLFV